MPSAATSVSVASSVMPMKPTLMPWTFLISYGGSGVLPVAVSTTLAASHWKSAPAYGSFVEVAPVDRVTAAVLHAQQLGDALVELVIADTGDVEAHLVERLDRRLVVEQAREGGRAADQVAGGHGEAVTRWPCAQLVELGRQVLATAGRRLRRRFPAAFVSRWP